jgi:hypothetical protein
MGFFEPSVPLSSAILSLEAILLFASSWSWLRRLRRQLPRWRNALCFSALLLMTAVWVGQASLVFTNHVTDDVNLALIFFLILRPTALVATLLALALRRVSRLTAVTAGLLLFVGVPVAVY